MTRSLKNCPLQEEAGNSETMRGFSLTPSNNCCKEIIDACKESGWDVIFPDGTTPTQFRLELLRFNNLQGWKIKKGNSIFYWWFYLDPSNDNVFNFGILNHPKNGFKFIPIKQFMWTIDTYQKHLNFHKVRGASLEENNKVKKLCKITRGFGFSVEAIFKKEYLVKGKLVDMIYISKLYN